jgi:hypothetical protein
VGQRRGSEVRKLSCAASVIGFGRLLSTKTKPNLSGVLRAQIRFDFGSGSAVNKSSHLPKVQIGWARIQHKLGRDRPRVRKMHENIGARVWERRPTLPHRWRGNNSAGWKNGQAFAARFIRRSRDDPTPGTKPDLCGSYD